MIVYEIFYHTSYITLYKWSNRIELFFKYKLSSFRFLNQTSKNNKIRRVTLGKGYLSVVTNYRINFSHDLDWNNIEVLDTERNLNKRFLSETINIKQQKNNINLQTDISILNHVYIVFLNNIWHVPHTTLFDLDFVPLF